MYKRQEVGRAYLLIVVPLLLAAAVTETYVTPVLKMCIRDSLVGRHTHANARTAAQDPELALAVCNPMRHLGGDGYIVCLLYTSQLVAASVPISGILASGLFDKLVKMKYDIPNNKPEMFDDYMKEIDETLSNIVNA